MGQTIVDFTPPMQGIEGEFNTFRAGAAWFKRVEVGEEVVLVDIKNKEIMAHATVTKKHMGKLDEMAQLHAHRNHNQKSAQRERAAENLIIAMKRRYGPHIINETKTVTVLYLKLKRKQQQKRSRN